MTKKTQRPVPKLRASEWSARVTYDLRTYGMTIKRLEGGVFRYALWAFGTHSERLAYGEKKTFSSAKRALTKIWKEHWRKQGFR